MKKIVLFFALSLALISGPVFASFPVKNQTETKTTASQSTANSTEFKKSDVKKELKKAMKDSKSQKAPMDTELIITLLLWFFLGGLAAHRWYKGKPVGWNILYILTAGGCGIWAIVDLINILTGKF